MSTNIVRSEVFSRPAKPQSGRSCIVRYSRRRKKSAASLIVIYSLTDVGDPGTGGAMPSPGPRYPPSHGKRTEITDAKFTRCPDDPSTRAPNCDVTFRETKLSRREQTRVSVLAALVCPSQRTSSFYLQDKSNVFRTRRQDASPW